MNTSQLHTATEKCELYLNKVKKYNIDHEILPSETKVVDRLLYRTLDMKPVYEELAKTFTDRQYQIFIDIILNSAAFWNPDAAKKLREDKAELLSVNNLISNTANELAKALSKRDKLSNLSGFSSDTHYHICDVIDAASQGNGHYRGFLRENLKSLTYQYDLKYWPSLSNIAKAIALDAEASNVRATDPLTEAATTSERTSKSDFLRAFFASIDQNTDRVGNGLPAGVKINDNSLSVIVNCALDLDVDDLVDSSYVKGVRQRLRKTNEKQKI
ncbi:MAG: hypothetical protein DIZ78_17630 [endosymbiont of Escarpia spicata]|uniref:Uncharacterized protein n=1 Tax=endosymbiont of Escarpia spicata TaxID=2200908 RepID=A0A370DA17_9GAMM|nr:MAG: hypothetical protein DIZ78_17630 [endosymbiont of Escarpia spicata]